LQDNADLTPEEFGQFLAGRPDLSPKAWPRYVWLTDRLPTTATNKVLKRALTAAGATPQGGVLWTRHRQTLQYTREYTGNARRDLGVWADGG
jgi:fatty-acyl-CoA synthase